MYDTNYECILKVKSKRFINSIQISELIKNSKICPIFINKSVSRQHFNIHLFMKKIFCISLFLSASFVLCFSQNENDGFWQKRLEKYFDRKAAPNSGPVPDYSNHKFWAASPFMHDTSDSIPAFLTNEKREETADVFFIHPTTFLGKLEGPSITTASKKELRKLLRSLPELPWNADLSDESLNRKTDMSPILFQASVFNGSCRVFAPRYRQANIKAFFVPNSEKAQQAFNLAYSDIKQAFEYYLSHYNNNRPVIIASHSQGSLHAIRLLQEFFDGKPLQKQLVCAYIIGYHVPLNAFKTLPIGDSPTATGCFVTWRTFKEGEIPNSIAKEKGNSQCVNPLTWKTDSDWAPDNLNSGALFDFQKVLPHFTGAGIEPKSRILWVKIPENVNDKLNKLKNFHVLDYNLFWMNIRENVKVRTFSYLNNQTQP